jgi:hypothetical protein
LRAVSGAQLTVLNYEGVAGAAKVFMPARILFKICIKLRATGFDHRFRRQTKKWVLLQINQPPGAQCW